MFEISTKHDTVQAALELCDRTYDGFISDDDLHQPMEGLWTGLTRLRTTATPHEWKQVGPVVRAHRLHPLLLQSPFARRAFEKPRGYAADAELIDLIYGCGQQLRQVNGFGELLYGLEFEFSGCRSVRYRRGRLASEIDNVAAERAPASVLSIACGHLREAELSASIRTGHVRLTAIDQDAGSVAVVAREYGPLGILPHVGNILDVLRRRLSGAPFDLVYAAGLYDYLNDKVASALTAALFHLLSPNGRLLLANFTPQTREVGYLEACLDWRLIYRDEAGMNALLRWVPQEQVVALEQFRDPDGNVTFLRVVRA